jgi:hypothetical protein
MSDLYCGKPVQEPVVLRRTGRAKGGLNSKLHAGCGTADRPIAMLLSEGRTSDHAGAAAMLDTLPTAPAHHTANSAKVSCPAGRRRRWRSHYTSQYGVR